MRVDTASLADGNVVTGGATDPLAAAELLRGAREVTYRGKVRLHGVKVRHYSGTTDIGGAAAAASARTKPALTAAEKGFTTDRVPFDAYLDDAGRLRKVRERFHFANGDARGCVGDLDDGAARLREARRVAAAGRAGHLRGEDRRDGA